MSPLEQSKLTQAFHNILAESVEQSYEVIAGVKKHYLAEGDRVLYEKEDAFITRIVRNGEYLGKRAQPKAIP
jgi:nitrogen fixation/metabolism regulation signal transduction histidine kinase